MNYKRIIEVCIVLLSTQSALSLTIGSTRINHDEAFATLTAIKNSILDNADEGGRLLTQQETKISNALNILLPSSIATIDDHTKQTTIAIEEMETALDKGGNHHVISICISYGPTIQVQKNIKAKLSAQISTSHKQAKKSADQGRSQINTLKEAANTIEPMIDVCNANPDPDTCFNDVVTKANAVGDESNYGILKAYSDGFSYAQNLYRLTLRSVNFYVDSTIKTLQEEVDNTKKCIDTELS